MRYEQLEHTADVMIKAHGRTLEECYGNAAYALFDTMVDASTIVPSEEIDIVQEGHDLGIAAVQLPVGVPLCA